MADEYKELQKFTTNPKYRAKVIEKIHRDRDREYENRKKKLNDDISRLNKAERTEIQRISSSRWEKVTNDFLVNRTEGKVNINGREALFSSIKGAEINMIPGYRTVTTGQAKTKKKASLGGAIVGGMVAGPVGAVIGGSSMGKTKTVGSAVSNQIPTCTHMGVMVNLDGFVQEIPIITYTIDQSGFAFSSAQNKANDIVSRLRQLAITEVPETFLRPEEEASVKSIQNQRENKRRELQDAVDDVPTYELPKMYRTKEQWEMSDEEYLEYLREQDIVRGEQQDYYDEMDRQNKAKMRAEAKAARDAKMAGMSESFKDIDFANMAKNSGSIVSTILLWILSIFCLVMMLGSFISGGIASGFIFLILAAAINPLMYNVISDKIYKYPRPINYLVFVIGFIIAIVCLPSSASQPSEAKKAWKTPTNSSQKVFYGLNYQIPDNWETMEDDNGRRVYYYPYEEHNDGFVYLQCIESDITPDEFVEELKATGDISVTEHNSINIASTQCIQLKAVFTAENKSSYDCIDYAFSFDGAAYLISFLDKDNISSEMTSYSQEFMRYVNTNNSFDVVSEPAEPEYLPEEIVEEPVEVEEVQEFVRTTDTVKIRAEASTECDVLGKAQAGEEFELVDEVDGWSKIKYEGQEAYIKSDYVEKVQHDVTEYATEDVESFVLKEGQTGKYAQEDDFDGYKEFRYYLPKGKYTAKPLKDNCQLMIETISTHLEDGYKTSNVVEHIKFNGTSDVRTITIKDDECIILMINSEIEFTPVTVENAEPKSKYEQKGEEIGNNMTEHLQNNDFSAIGQDLKDIKSAVGEIYKDAISE